MDPSCYKHPQMKSTRDAIDKVRGVLGMERTYGWSVSTKNTLTCEEAAPAYLARHELDEMLKRMDKIETEEDIVEFEAQLAHFENLLAAVEQKHPPCRGCTPPLALD